MKVGQCRNCEHWDGAPDSSGWNKCLLLSSSLANKARAQADAVVLALADGDLLTAPTFGCTLFSRRAKIKNRVLANHPFDDGKLYFTKRVITILRENDISTVEQLITYQKDFRLDCLRGAGEASVKEISEALEALRT